MKKLSNRIYVGAEGRESTFDLYLSEKPQKRPLVIFAHGYKGFKDWGSWGLVGEAFAKSGFDFLKFNFSHNGGTKNNPIDFPDLDAFSKNTYSKELTDLDAICRLARQGITSESRIWRWQSYVLIGHSRGGGITILHAARDKAVKALATWASVADFKERFNFDLDAWKRKGVVTVKNGRTGQEMPHKYLFYQDFLDNRSALDIPLAATSLDIPWLIVHGLNDEAVDHQNAMQLASRNEGAQRMSIPGAGHTFGSSHPWQSSVLPDKLENITRLTINFFKEKSAK